jgi:hypothetical protein
MYLTGLWVSIRPASLLAWPLGILTCRICGVRYEDISFKRVWFQWIRFKPVWNPGAYPVRQCCNIATQWHYHYGNLPNYAFWFEFMPWNLWGCVLCTYSRVSSLELDWVCCWIRRTIETGTDILTSFSRGKWLEPWFKHLRYKVEGCYQEMPNVIYESKSEIRSVQLQWELYKCSGNILMVYN